MFAVYHEDKFTRYLRTLSPTLSDARTYVGTVYSGRFSNGGKDRVLIIDEAETVVAVYEVEWGMAFEAVKRWEGFKSSSSSRTYTVQLNREGFISCNCKGWTIYKGRPRSCVHTDEVVAREGYNLKPIGQYLFLEDTKLSAAKQKWAGTTTPQQKFAVLIAEYENAIARMAQLDPKDILTMLEEVELCKFKVESYMLLLEEQGIDGLVQYEAAQAKLGNVLSH